MLLALEEGESLPIVNNYSLGSGSVVLAGGTLSMAVLPLGNGIGIHFIGNGASVLGSAGVAPMSNWNNLSGASFSSTPVTDNNGAATTANLTTANVAGTWASGSSNQLLNGYIYSVWGLSTTISGIPYSQYSLYAYIADSTVGNDESVTLNGSTYYYGTTNIASYMQISNTTSGSYPTGNYVVATGLTGNSQTVLVQGSNNQGYGSFTGFEIVNTGPTTPAGNAVTLTADSTIDVTGPSSSAITGQLTIGSNRLCLTGGGSGANTAYSLTLGNSGGVLLTGNPTFDVADNGSGVGTLILGALNDGGATRTITKSDSGALTICAAAGAMNSNDIVNVNGGTLASNNATALGTRTAVNLAAGAVFSLGASQTLGALGDSGTVVVNGASVQLNGNALTVGSGNNLSSTFSGVITNGTGGAGSLVKAGSGTLSLRGSNTYTGPTAVNAGELIVNGSLASPVTVNSGGTLGGTGHLSSGTVSAGGCIAPGNLPQGLSFSGGLLLASGAEMDYALDTPSTSDEIACGSLVVSSPLGFSNFDFTWTSNFAPGTYDLIEAGSLPSSILGNSNSGTIDGLPATLAVHNNDLVLTVVPEPSTLALLSVGTIGLVCEGMRRRTRR